MVGTLRIAQLFNPADLPCGRSKLQLPNRRIGGQPSQLLERNASFLLPHWLNDSASSFSGRRGRQGSVGPRALGVGRTHRVHGERKQAAPAWPEALREETLREMKPQAEPAVESFNGVD